MADWKPDGNTTERSERVGKMASEFIACLVKCVPEGADKSAALRRTREAVGLALGAIVMDSAD